MKCKKLSAGFILFMQLSYAQIGISTPNPQAALDIVSKDSGILIPRMTAAQIEQISAPTEGELAFSTTNTGAVVNLIGFWYYDGTTWKPIIANSSGGINIYNSNGTLTGNRVAAMNGHSLNVGPSKLFVNGTTDGNVGVMTSTPTQKLDVNGGMRIRNLSSGNVFTTLDGTLNTDASVVYHLGDIRFSSRTADHNGWYLLDGRALTSLPANVQARAAALGISGTLPNAANKYIKQGTPGTTTGASSITLTKQNMPDFTLSGNTSFLNHAHTLISPGNASIRGTDIPQTSAGAANVWQLAGGAQAGSTNTSQAYTSSAEGSHSHTISVPTGGTDTPIALNPGYIQLNYFIFLGN
ncbi:hypothetical protein [Chryseobacterium daeguense]|uniref:hypothetical protein n=1 Tax=Chryseobacterium daeguense TaxID=412438 RepID=UPI0009D6C237|nr:hypothetical protein [Chryseobacterium daeguense]